MQPIADWLAKLGVPEYAERFEANRIDVSVLPDLTDQDLEKLGVLLGDRRKILRAIRESTSAQDSVPAGPANDEAERRQLTVMFCDLVGSTALSAKLDPEDLRGIVQAYHRCCTAVVERNSGYVAKYMGDGVLVYLAIRRLTSMMPNVPFTPGLRLSKPCQSSRSLPAHRCKCVSALPPGSWSLAISSARVRLKSKPWWARHLILPPACR